MQITVDRESSEEREPEVMKVKKEKSRKGEKRKSQKFGGKNMLAVFALSKVEAKSSRDTNIQIIDDQGQDLSEVSDAA